MARETAELGNVRNDTGTDPELREAERKIYDLLSGSGLPGELSTRLFDYIDLAVSKAVGRAIQEMQGGDQKDQRTDNTGRRQSAFVHDEQRLADSVASRVRKDRSGVQWSQVDHRGRGFKG